MQYSLDKIDSVEACDDLLTRAQQKKRALERNRRNLGESIDTFRIRMDRISKESADVRSSLEALTTAHHAMPEGKDKMTIYIMIKRLEVRQAKLDKQAYTCNVSYLLIKELRYNRLDSQVSAMEDYIDTIARIRTALSQPVMFIRQAADFSRPPMARQSLPKAPAFFRFMSTDAQLLMRYGKHELQGNGSDQQSIVQFETQRVQRPF